VAAVAAANAQQAAGGGGGPAHPDAGGAAQRAAAAAILSRGGGGGGSGGLGGGSGQETPGSTPRWSVGGTPKAKGAHRHAKRPLKRQLQQPFMQLMKWTMPKVGAYGRAVKSAGVRACVCLCLRARACVCVFLSVYVFVCVCVCVCVRERERECTGACACVGTCRSLPACTLHPRRLSPRAFGSMGSQFPAAVRAA
jgi:hypothetical protein